MNNNDVNEIQEQLLEKAKSYVPEWKQDFSNKDLGMALIEIFSSMHLDTMNKYQKLTDKWCIELLNYLHTSLKSKTPAKGYVHFGLSSDDVEGSELPMGTLLKSSVKLEDGSDIPIETLDDVFVTPSKIAMMMESKTDYISYIEETSNIPVFSFARENMQEHNLYIGHANALSISKFGEVWLTLFEEKGEFIDRKWLEKLCEIAEFSYSTEEGFVPFESVTIKNHSLVFSKMSTMATFESITMDEFQQAFIKCCVKDSEEMKELALRDIRVSTKSRMLLLDNINANGIQTSPKEVFFPFSERPSIYNEVYFSSDEVLGKKGAIVELSFIMDFVEVSLEVEHESEVVWKLVMPKTNIKIEKELDIAVQEVIFEYYNGKGYVNLFENRPYKFIFNAENGMNKNKKAVRFICPNDLETSIVGGIESRYIRARILKVSNQFKTTGKYITPRMSDVYFAYKYNNLGVRPDCIIEENNLEKHHYTSEQCLDSIYPYKPIKQTGDNVPTLYIGFDKPLKEGPIRVLFDITKETKEVSPELTWQYYGENGWKDAQVVDETNNFSHSGILSFTGLPDHKETTIFNQKQYFIKIMEPAKKYENVTKSKLPLINGIYMNGVKVMTIQSDITQYLTLPDYESELIFKLNYTSIYHFELYVNETATISMRDEKLLKERIIYKEVDEVIQKWVRWNRVEDFRYEDGENRVYTLDANKGILEFSRAHMLPAPRMYNGIYIKMSVGGGQGTNLEVNEVNGLDLSIGFINQVTNPLPLYGGTEKETIEKAQERKLSEHKHKFRAVTVQDYEKIVRDYSQGIHKVQCFSNKDINGNRKVGDVTIVVLNKEYEKSGYFFETLRLEILEYLKDKVFTNLITKNKLHIIEPNFVTIKVSVEIGVHDFNQIFEAKKNITEALKSYLDPIAGNFSNRGFEIGKVPNRNQIEAVLKNIKQVEVIKNLMLIGELQEGAITTSINMEEVGEIPYVLPLNGEHNIIIYVE